MLRCKTNEAGLLNIFLLVVVSYLYISTVRFQVYGLDLAKTLIFCRESWLYDTCNVIFSG